MSQNQYGIGWPILPNPFYKVSKQVLPDPIQNNIDTSNEIIGRISGRRADITRIITDEQSAIFLVGTPRIGKSTLIRYLQQPPDAEWSWRNELADLQGQSQLNHIHFAQLDLTPLENITNQIELLSSFVRQCIKALHSVYTPDGQSSSSNFDLKELRGLLRAINRETPNARYFLILDAIERLSMPGMQWFPLDSSKAQTPQELGLALLDHCGAMHMLVDLIDEFTNFGVILSVESLPRPKIDDQFHHVSLDLARFTTMILQAFTWEDTIQFLAQPPENFGAHWANMFKALGGTSVFSKSEQEWLLQQAGTHPYLLQQLCLQTFQFKQEYANIHKSWPELQEKDKTQLIELANESLSGFLAHIWQRLQTAIEKGSPETKSNFSKFTDSLVYKRADNIIDPTDWYDLGSELRYILYSEGIVRYDRLQPVHFPGSILCQYLSQKAKENDEQPPTPLAGRNLIIRQPGNQPVLISLSELEYRLIKTLLQHPERCSEGELMKGAWGSQIEKPRFTQRMHQLRKKLRDQGTGTEIIENSYGGIYSINHPDWLHLE